MSSKVNSITLPRAVPPVCVISQARNKPEVFHCLAPLWIAAGVSLVIVVALFTCELATSLKILIAAFSGAAITTALSIFYYITVRHEAARKAETVALVNHHIRNALQTLHLLELPPSEDALMHEASRRIQWTLREVLTDRRK